MGVRMLLLDLQRRTVIVTLRRSKFFVSFVVASRRFMDTANANTPKRTYADAIKGLDRTGEAEALSLLTVKGCGQVQGTSIVSFFCYLNISHSNCTSWAFSV